MAAEPTMPSFQASALYRVDLPPVASSSGLHSETGSNGWLSAILNGLSLASSMAGKRSSGPATNNAYTPIVIDASTQMPPINLKVAGSSALPAAYFANLTQPVTSFSSPKSSQSTGQYLATHFGNLANATGQGLQGAWQGVTNPNTYTNMASQVGRAFQTEAQSYIADLNKPGFNPDMNMKMAMGAGVLNALRQLSNGVSGIPAAIGNAWEGKAVYAPSLQIPEADLMKYYAQRYPVSNFVGEQVPYMIPVGRAAGAVGAVSKTTTLGKAAQVLGKEALLNSSMAFATTPGTYQQRVGNATVAGATTALVSLGATGIKLTIPQLDAAIKEYLVHRTQQRRAGLQVTISYEDFVAYFQQKYGWTDADIAFYENRSTVPSQNHPFNRPFWSPGKEQNPLRNAYGHSKKHPETFGFAPGDPRYVEKVHQLLDNLPENTHLKAEKRGINRYYSESVPPSGKGVLFSVDPDGAPKTAFIPDNQWHYFEKQGGQYKGKIK